VFTATVKKSMSNVVEPMIKRFKQFKSEVFLLDDLARLFDDPRKITAASLMDDMFTDGIPATVARLKNAGASSKQLKELDRLKDTQGHTEGYV